MLHQHEIWSEQPELGVELFKILSRLWRNDLKTITILVEGSGKTSKKRWHKVYVK